MAGLTAAAVVIPQAIAYSAIAGLPLVAALYTSLLALVVYALVGSSPALSVTTTSTLAILTAGALSQVAPTGDAAALMTGASTLAILVGTILVVASFLRMGVVADFISEPVLLGFKAGVGLLIIVDQVPHLLGVQFPKADFLQNLAQIVAHFSEASVPTLLLALAMLALLMGMQRFLPRAPAALLTVVAGIAATACAGLEGWGIKLVGDVQGGLPTFALPDPKLVGPLWHAAVGIALMSFVETVAAGRAFMGPGENRPVPNRELLAIGLANIAGGFFQAMPAGGGTSQTAVNSGAGARSQVSGLVTAAIVLAVLLFLAPVVRLMPKATLAAVVVASCMGMIRPKEFRAVLKVRAMEFSWAVASLVGVVLLGTLEGIFVAVVLSLLSLLYQANTRPVVTLGRKPGTNVFRPLSPEHADDETFPGLLLVKIEGTVHFANVQRIGDVIWKMVHEHRPQVLVLDCSAMPDIEYTALKMLVDAQGQLRREGLSLWLAALNPEPLNLVHKTNLGELLGRDRMFFTVEQAVEQYTMSSPSCHAVATGEDELGREAAKGTS